MAHRLLADDSPVVLIVDDDEGIRDGLRDLLASAGFEAMAFGCTTELLAAGVPDRLGCLILDIRLPGASGLELQQQLATLGSQMPIIFMTGYADVPTSVRAMKAGAVDFLTKPFDDGDMLDAVRHSITRHRAYREAMSPIMEARDLAETLTRREAEIMEAVAAGLLNKQIAYQIGLSEITIKICRGKLMRKMRARSIAELVRKWELLRHDGLAYPSPASILDCARPVLKDLVGAS